MLPETEQLQKAMFQYRHWRDVGEIVLLAGVDIEVLIDAFWPAPVHPPLLRGRRATSLIKTRSERLKRWGMFIIGIVTAFGILVSLMCGKWADDKSDDITTLLEERIVRTTQRAIDSAKFLQLLKSGPSGVATVLYKHEDTEAYLFALSICKALAAGGWTVNREPQSIPSVGGDPIWANKDVPSDLRYDTTSGLTIWTRDVAQMNVLKSSGDALKLALGAASDRGEVIFLASDPSLPNNDFVIVVGQNLP